MKTCRTKILGFTLLLAGLALCGTGLWLLLSPDEYQATVRIRRQPSYRDTDMYLRGNDRVFDCFDPYFIHIQLEIIQSPLVLSNVVESLNLNIKWAENTAKPVKFMQRRMNLQVISNTTDIDISYSSTAPNEAASVANAIANSYHDYLIESRNRQFREGIRRLTEQHLKEEHEIQIRQEELEQLGKQLNLPNLEPAEEGLKSNYSSYFLAKTHLHDLEEAHQLLSTKIENEKLAFQFHCVKDWEVKIVDAAKPPQFPNGSNRWLGAMSLAVGLFSSTGGFLLLKSSRRCQELDLFSRPPSPVSSPQGEDMP